MFTARYGLGLKIKLSALGQWRVNEGLSERNERHSRHSDRYCARPATGHLRWPHLIKVEGGRKKWSDQKNSSNYFLINIQFSVTEGTPTGSTWRTCSYKHKKKKPLMYFSVKILLQSSFARFVLENKSLNSVWHCCTGTKNKDTAADQHITWCSLL